jgi:hypothetical protein
MLLFGTLSLVAQILYWSRIVRDLNEWQAQPLAVNSLPFNGH